MKLNKTFVACCVLLAFTIAPLMVAQANAVPTVSQQTMSTQPSGYMGTQATIVQPKMKEWWHPILV